MTTLAHDDPLHPQLLRHLGVGEGDAGQLDIVVEEAVVHTVVAYLLR